MSDSAIARPFTNHNSNLTPNDRATQTADGVRQKRSVFFVPFRKVDVNVRVQVKRPVRQTSIRYVHPWFRSAEAPLDQDPGAAFELLDSVASQQMW